MSGLIEALLLAGALVLAVPVGVLFVQVLAAMPYGGTSRSPGGAGRPRIAVLVPAHDEAAGIGETIRGIRAQLVDSDRLLVVADNCSDDTATLAARAGAEVVERFDTRLRGKGYALDFGVNALAADPPEVLVVVDADCHLEADALPTIAALCEQTGRPIQALYLMHLPAGAAIGQRVGAFAWRVKNYVRPLGSSRLGMPCQLMGTGMAFPWGRVAKISMATGHIAEDMLLGVQCARAGAPPLFCPDATVASAFAAAEAGAQSQRRRWEHGHIGLILAEAPRLLARGLRHGDARLVGMALDLAVPPLALLGILIAVLVALSTGFTALSGSATPFVAATLLMSAFAGAVLLAWVRHGRTVITLRQLLWAPIYALGKVPLYLAFLTRRQVEWVRTRRDS
jgi:hypothetical protein